MKSGVHGRKSGQHVAQSASDARVRRPRHVTPGGVAQEHLLDAAVELFHREGIHAVGVDAVVKRAGVNKMSLYRQFASKDELVLAYLKRKDSECMANLEASIARHPGNPAEQLKQIFRDLAQRACAPGYRGCPFVNVSAEFPDATHPARQLVAANKAALTQRLAGIAHEAGATEPASLADALALLMEGAYAASQTFGPGAGPLKVLPDVAATLIDTSTARIGPHPQ